MGEIVNLNNARKARLRREAEAVERKLLDMTVPRLAARPERRTRA